MFMSLTWHAFTNWLFGVGGVVAIIAAVAWIAFFVATFIGLPGNVRFMIFQVAAGTSLFAAAWSYAATTNYRAGQKDTLAIIKRMDTDAGNRAEQKLDEVDKCYAAGRDWDLTRGVCGN